jgi:hypothetical protein
MSRAPTFVLLAALLAGPGPAQGRSPAAGWLDNLAVTASGAVSHVDNASRTSAEPNRQDATTYELNLGATRRQQLAASWLLSLGADATWLHVADYTLAGHVKLGPRLALQRKFGLGPFAPVLQFDAAFTHKSARLDLDRGWSTEAGVRLGKRFAPAFRAGVAARWMEHNARSAVFDLNQRSFSVDATWDISDRWSLTGSAGRLSGDIVANAAWPVWAMAISGGFGPAVFNYYTSRPWQVTEIYGSGWVSYNVEADVDLWSLAASCAATEHTSLELRYSSAFVVNKIGIRYPTDSWGLGLVHRF